MSEIPYYFHTPIPKYFRENGLFKNPKNIAFISWCFERCSPDERIVPHDSQLIVLKPYQFIFGRLICSAETGLTQDEIRTQQARWESLGLLRKTPNKTPNRFTVYEWVLTAFCKPNPQLIPQKTPNKPPTNPHNLEEEIDRSKENHPSSVSLPDDGIDDSFQEFKFLVNNAEKIIKISQFDLDQCIEIKGSLDAVKQAIEYILRSPGRKKEIQNWPNAMATWEIKSSIKPRLKENEEMAKRLVELYGNASGWRCEFYKDTKKDQRGILFYSTAAVGNPETFFFSFVEPEFKEKCSKVIRDKKMQKSRIPNT